MIQAGLYASGSDPMIDEAIRVWPQLDGFLAEASPAGGAAGSFQRLRDCLGKR
jgi:flagellum-specific ATP synthase